MIKLNIGAGPIWNKDGWHTLDHKFKDNSDTSIVGDANNIPLNNDSCSTLFTSHMFEHIPHTRLERILIEFNRVLKSDGILRILTPDLKKAATAYVNEDSAWFDKARSEDENLRVDLGYGGMFMNFVVSPGQDTALYSRNLDEFIAGYAHLYSYDFTMLKILLERTGFYCIEQKEFCVSEIKDYEEPMHVSHLEPVWQDLNQEFYKKNNLVHFYDSKEGKYNINFKITGFDRDPVTSLIIEAKKKKYISPEQYQCLNESKTNNNRYAWSLMKDENFLKRHEAIMKTIKKITKKN